MFFYKSEIIIRGIRCRTSPNSIFSPHSIIIKLEAKTLSAISSVLVRSIVKNNSDNTKLRIIKFPGLMDF